LHESLKLPWRKDRGRPSAEIQGIAWRIMRIDQRHLLQEGFYKGFPQCQVCQGVEITVVAFFLAEGDVDIDAVLRVRSCFKEIGLAAIQNFHDCTD